MEKIQIVQKMVKVLIDYTKKKHITASTAILTDYAEELYEEGYRKQEWISVDEALPDNDGKYLVAREECGRYSISVRKFRKEVPCWYTGYCGHWERRTNGITHWMPLPEAPKGGTE